MPIATAAFYGLLATLATYILGWLGSFLFNWLWAAPAELHREQVAIIDEQRLIIEAQSTYIECLNKKFAELQQLPPPSCSKEPPEPG